MAISLSFTNVSIWLKIRGEVSRNEVSEGIFQAVADQRFVVGSYLVLDLQDTKTDFSSADIQFFVLVFKGIRRKLSSPIIAIVSDSLHYGLMRMLQSYADSRSFEVKIFKREKEAIEWLSLSS
jgi:hypothetical protein